jgi:hypothetical protein
MSDSVKPLSVEIDEAVRADWGRNPWYKRGVSHFNPSMPDMREPDALYRHVLEGWLPPGPFITPQTKVTLIGGCFGGALADHLKSLNYAAEGTLDVLFLPINETLCTTRALRQMFEWQFEGIKPDPAIAKGNRALDINFSDDLWAGTLSPMRSTDVFVLLLSTAELWCDEPTGAVLWREVPANTERQKFRTSSVAENLADLREIQRLIRKHRPDAKVVYTLSPIPLIATYRPEGAIAANTVSKAVVRAALDEFYQEARQDGHTFYFPYYEAVLEGFGASPYGGHFNGDRRHVNDIVFEHMTVQFEVMYCGVDQPSRSVFKDYVRSRVDTGDLPPSLIEAADRGDRRALQHLVNGYQRSDDLPTARLVAQYAAECLGLSLDEPDDGKPWTETALAWQVLPSLERLGPAPQTLPIPATAWDYGAVCGPLHAEEPNDLLVRVTLRVLEGAAGIMLIRPNGSPLTDKDFKIGAQDGEMVLELRVYPQDGPAHILLRNYDSEGIAGTVDVLGVATRAATAAIGPRRKMKSP